MEKIQEVMIPLLKRCNLCKLYRKKNQFFIRKNYWHRKIAVIATVTLPDTGVEMTDYVMVHISKRETVTIRILKNDCT